MSPNPLRIALITEHASPLASLGSVDAGGQNVYVDELARHLAHLGCCIDVFTRRDSPGAEVVVPEPGVRVIQIEAGPPHFVPKDEQWPLMPLFRERIADFVRRENAAYDVIHGNFWMSGWVAVELGEQLETPVVHIFHAMGETKRRHQGAADSSPEERIQVEHDVIARANRLIAQCPEECRELIEDYGAQPEKISIIPSAVDTDVFRPVPKIEARRALELKPDEQVVGYVGRILPRKDVPNILKAAALALPQLRRLRVIVVGGESRHPDPAITPEIGQLQWLSESLGIPDIVTFYGNRQPEELCTYYSAADVVVSTPWYEPFGLTPLEAMACGRPVIGSAVGGIKHTVVHGETGLLVPPKDPAALAGGLVQILGQPGLGEKMGASARLRVEQYFVWSMTAQRTLELYRATTGTGFSNAQAQPELLSAGTSDFSRVPAAGLVAGGLAGSEPVRNG